MPRMIETDSVFLVDSLLVIFHRIVMDVRLKTKYSNGELFMVGTSGGLNLIHSTVMVN